MSGISEKAKTLPEWHEELHKKGEVDCGSCIVLGTKDACSDCAEILGMHPKLVRLEDAQQEIDKLEKDIKEKSEGYAKVCARLHEHIMDLGMERGEQKQKLQQIFESYINAYPLDNKVDAEVRKVLHKMFEELPK